MVGVTRCGVSVEPRGGVWGMRGRLPRRRRWIGRKSCQLSRAPSAPIGASVSGVSFIGFRHEGRSRRAFRDFPCRRPGLETRLGGQKLTSADIARRGSRARVCATPSRVTGASLERLEPSTARLVTLHCREAPTTDHRLNDRRAPFFDVPPTPPHRDTRGDGSRARHPQGGRASHPLERRRARRAAPRAPQRASAREGAKEPRRGCHARTVRHIRLRSGR